MLFAIDIYQILSDASPGSDALNTCATLRSLLSARPGSPMNDRARQSAPHADDIYFFSPS